MRTKEPTPRMCNPEPLRTPSSSSPLTAQVARLHRNPSLRAAAAWQWFAFSFSCHLHNRWSTRTKQTNRQAHNPQPPEHSPSYLVGDQCMEILHLSLSSSGGFEPPANLSGKCSNLPTLRAHNSSCLRYCKAYSRTSPPGQELQCKARRQTLPTSSPTDASRGNRCHMWHLHCQPCRRRSKDPNWRTCNRLLAPISNKTASP
mmetsp:Transcript_104327/g.164605  ORF Transcript_104327/g.164605 Transcript_104327/m.164605 type:complete len:202 (+) Transcript_104327:1799-2404(+)